MKKIIHLILAIFGITFYGNAQSYCTSGLYYTDYGNNPCLYGSAIDNFSLANLNQTATGCSGGFADYTSFVINLAQGEAYSFSATSTSYYMYSEYLGIWVDFNDNFSFDDAGEMLFTSDKSGAFSGIINIPVTAPVGNHRMRVRLKNDYLGTFASTDACTFYYQGEAQDYTVNIGNAPACSMVKNVIISAIALTSAKVNWNCNDCNGSFVVEYGLKGFSPGTGTTIIIADYSDLPVTINGLSSSTTYDVYVKKNCGANGFSNSYPVVSFTTLYDLCSTLTTITCGQQIDAVIPPGEGVINNAFTGKELLYQFTPSASGVYTITSVNSAYVSLYMKKASSGCNTEGWETVVTLGYGTSILDTLEAGVNYYLIVDGGSKDFTTYYSFNIDCYEPSAPCDHIITAKCGETITVEIPAGAGDYTELAGYANYYGKERIISFTPLKTGTYTLQTMPVSYEDGYVGFSYKKASDGCSPVGWHFIQNGIQHNGQIDLIGTLVGGVEYYILIDAYNIGGAKRNVIINCLDEMKPCNNIQTISCGTEVTWDVPSGIGSMVPQVCMNNSWTSEKIGKEKIFQFTPATSGRAALWVKAQSYNLYAGYYFKEASTGCNNDNWQCLNIFNSGDKILFPGTLNAGTTYYLMVDVAELNGGSVTFEITFPEDWNPCNSITSITCGTPVSASIPAGIGKFELYEDSYSNYSYNGKEILYSFTATVSGTHQFTVTQTDYNPPISYQWKFINYYIKDINDGCNGNGWTKITSAVMPPDQWSYPIYLPYPLTKGHAYYIMLDAAYDGANQTFVISCPETTYPCDNITTGISCNTEYSFSNPAGLGQFNPLPASNSITLYGGKESIFEFKPSISGTYQIELVSALDYNSVGYFVKEASDGCNNNNWKLIGSYLYPGQKATFPLTLSAGTSYYIMADGETAGKVFKINCPSDFYNPCSEIIAITNCNSSVRTLHTSGLGQFANQLDDFNQEIQTPGKERIFSFTPSINGVYGLEVETGGTGQIVYLFKKSNEGCSATGWLYLGGEYYGYGLKVKIPLELKAGETYFIMADAINTDGSDQTFKIICPAENPCNNITAITACGWQNQIEVSIPAGINSYLLTPCFSEYQKINGGARMYSFSPSVSGYYSIEIENGSTSSQYFFVKDATLGCDGNNWKCMNTDYRAIYYSPFPFIKGHVYYILVASVYPSDQTSIFSFHLNCSSGIVQYADSDGDGYGNPEKPLYDYPISKYGYVYDNTDCNDNAASAYLGAKEICGNKIDDDCDGLVDEGCCNISVDAGPDVTTYYGYSLSETVVRTVKITGGTAPFAYSWTMNRPLICNSVNKDGDETFSSGSCTNAVCPVSGGLSVSPVCNGNATITAKLMNTATVCVTVTDALGCQSTDCFVINAKDIRCFSKDNSNTKVLMCHKGKTTCVNAADVSLHLGHGDKLGECASPATGENNRISTEENEEHKGLNISVSPNPSNNQFTINIESSSNETVELKVYDISGRVVYSARGNANRQYQFGNNFISGAYVAEIRQGANRSTVKLIKQ